MSVNDRLSTILMSTVYYIWYSRAPGCLSFLAEMFRIKLVGIFIMLWIKMYRNYIQPNLIIFFQKKIGSWYGVIFCYASLEDSNWIIESQCFTYDLKNHHNTSFDTFWAETGQIFNTQSVFWKLFQKSISMAYIEQSCI